MAQYHQAHADANRIADVDTAGAALAAIAVARSKLTAVRRLKSLEVAMIKSLKNGAQLERVK